MLRRLQAPLVAIVLALPVAFAASTAAAQADDWDVKKNPFSKEIINKWKGILEKNPSDSAALRKLVDLYTRYSKVDKLIGEYEAALAKKPDSYALNMILGHLHRNRSQVKEAVAYYEAAAKIDPNDPAVHLARAELYRQQRKVPEATAAYEQALPLAKDNKAKKAIYRALADLYLDQKDIDRARKYFNDYIALDPSDVDARKELADALAKHGLHEEALKEFKEALAKLGTDPQGRVEVLARIGGEYEALGKVEDAITTYRQAMEATQKGHYLRKELTERIIDIHRKRQELRALIAYYEKTWSAGSRGHFEWDVLARLYEETGEQEKALDAYRKATKEAPYELDTQRRLIALLVRAGREDEAIKAYENVIRVAPGEPRFQLELAERYAKQGEKKKALAMAKEIAKRFPDDPGVHAALADMYVRWNEEQLALKEYETLVKIEPDDATHLVNLGEQWHQRGDKPKAQEIWKKIAAGKTPEGYARLAEVYAEHDMGSDAIDMYLKAIALKPKDPNLYKGLAGVLERQRQDDKAIDAWETVMKLTDGDVTQKPLRREARTRIIAVYQRKNGLLNKTREWQRKFQGSPPDIESGYFLAEAYLKLSKPDDARRILEGLLKVDPKDLDAKHQLVQVMKSLRRYDEAIALIQQLIVDNPGHERQYYTEIAELQLILHHYDEAIVHAKKAMEKSPNDAAAQERLAEIYAQGGSDADYKLAVEAYKRAIELNPRNFKVHKALAKLYENQGEYAETAKLYRQIVAHASDEETIRAAARKAIDVEEFLGTLGDLEKELAPLAFLFNNKATYRRILVEVYDRYVDPLVAKAKRGDAAAEKELIRLGEHGLKPLLEALTDSSDQQQQQIAVRVLGYLGNKNAAPPLVKLAMETSPERQAGPSPLPGGVLTIDPSAGVAMKLRVEALVAAGRLGDPRTIPQLVKLLENREVALREAAAWALGQTRDKKALEPLIKALDDTRSSVQAMACIGLGHINEKRGDGKALDAVAAVMKDASRGVEARAACAYALGMAGNPAYVPALAQVVGDGNDEVQVKAAWALGRIGDARAKGALLAAYWAKKEAVRDAVLWALARVMAGQPDTSPLPWVDPALAQEKIDYRTLVHGLVGELPRTRLPASVVKGQAKEIADGIEAALGRHRDVVVRVLRDLDGREGGLALGQLTAGLEAAPADEQAQIEKLIADVGARVAGKVDALCEHRDPEVRALAADILAKLQDQRAEARLVKLLEDESALVRMSAMASTQRYLAGGNATAAGGKQLAAAVGKRLSAPEFEERTAAAQTLGQLGAATETTLLAGAFADSDGFVREAAAQALARLKRIEAVPALIDASHADEARVRLAVAKALVAIGDPRAKARLAEMAKDDEDEDVRAAASKHL